jgi:hypothetical protein
VTLKGVDFRNLRDFGNLFPPPEQRKGQELTAQTLSLQIDLTGLAPGLYYYRVEEEGRTVKAGKVMVVSGD